MKRSHAATAIVLLLSGASACASATGDRAAVTPTAPAQPARPAVAATPPQPLVEFELMTWPEVKAALAAGKTTALIYTGGTEHRGPQNVNGGHNLMARETVKAIALKLGNAIALPVLPYTPNNASAALPGTIGLTNELLAAVLERISEQAIVTGFKNVIVMGDHGGGQPNVYRDTAKKLDDKHAPQGIHVYYCDEVYSKRMADFDAYLTSQKLPAGGHATIGDTSEMLYLGGDKGWVRKDLIATAVAAPRGEPSNGVSGDGRASSAELGKRVFDMKIDYAVRQIQQFLAAAKPQG
jgi:creatinine amidohydrolase/Fe(II)-dependent formamide hydrolase-like protein